MRTRLLVALMPCAILIGCGRAEAPGQDTAASAPPPTAAPTSLAPDVTLPEAAVAKLEGRSGKAVTGELQFAPMEGGVTIKGEIAGLPPGSEHGFHIHETGDCSSPDAESAGAHFNPEHAQHGGPTVAVAERHVGDVPNIKADAMGHAAVSASIPGASLHNGGPHDLVGKAVIVHEKRDDYVSQPGGDAGARIACGVIR